MASEKNMATNKWRKEKVKTYRFYLHKELDKDVMEWLEQHDNKRQYLIDLMRKDMDEKRPSEEV